MKILSTVMTSTELYMITRKRLPLDPVQHLSQALTLLKQNGELERILARWSA